MKKALYFHALSAYLTHSLSHPRLPEGLRVVKIAWILSLDRGDLDLSAALTACRILGKSRERGHKA